MYIFTYIYSYTYILFLPDIFTEKGKNTCVGEWGHENINKNYFLEITYFYTLAVFSFLLLNKMEERKKRFVVVHDFFLLPIKF